MDSLIDILEKKEINENKDFVNEQTKIINDISKRFNEFKDIRNKKIHELYELCCKLNSNIRKSNDVDTYEMDVLPPQHNSLNNTVSKETKCDLNKLYDVVDDLYLMQEGDIKKFWHEINSISSAFRDRKLRMISNIASEIWQYLNNRFELYSNCVDHTRVSITCVIKKKTFRQYDYYTLELNLFDSRACYCFGEDVIL